MLMMDVVFNIRNGRYSSFKKLKIRVHILFANKVYSAFRNFVFGEINELTKTLNLLNNQYFCYAH